MVQYIMFSKKQQNSLVAIMHVYKSIKKQVDKQLISDINYFNFIIKCNIQHFKIYYTT